LILHSCRALAVLLVLGVFGVGFASQPIPSAYAQEIDNVQVFGESSPALEENKDRQLFASCLAGWRDFLSASTPQTDVSDYFRDFFLWPSHYADVAAIQNQLNKSRYAVMAAFFRCDLERLKVVTEAYYRLEAELYFVRHYVQTDGDNLHVLTENAAERQKFQKEMIDYFIVRKESPDPEKDRALFSGYFDLFAAKYGAKARTYGSFGNDPAYSQLVEKFNDLLDTLKSFSEPYEQLKALGNEAIVEPAQAIGRAAAAAYDSPAGALIDLGKAIAQRFDACVETDDNRYCLSDIGSSADRADEDPFSFLGAPRTFTQVMISVRKKSVQRTDDVSKADMLKRYELLYGQLGGGGTRATLDRLDTLNAILGDGAPAKPGSAAIKGSLKPLQDIATCADNIVDKQCK